MEAKITSAFPKGHIIDVLFISHFHADHINGIDILKKHYQIKTVVLPLIDLEAKTLSKINNYLNGGNTFGNLIDDPGGYFGSKTRIVLVRQVGPDDSNQKTKDRENTEISSMGNSETISSGTMLKSGSNNHDWYFIPFNYKHIQRKNEFVAALAKLKLKLTDIDTTDKILYYKNKIKQAYTKVKGDLNENSMILFSGKSSSNRSMECYTSHNYHGFCNHHYHLLECGCLFLGDIDLNQPGIVSDIKNNLTAFLDFTGTIQIPHHGSVHNFNDSFLIDLNIDCAVFSYGTTNSFGHPSSRVIGEIVQNDIFPHLVDEHPNSVIIQYF